MLIKIPQGWEIPEREATPEAFYLNRRQFFKKFGLMSIGAAVALPGWNRVAAIAGNDVKSIYPAKRNEKFVLDRPLTDEWATAHYNNFYEGIYRFGATAVLGQIRAYDQLQ
jgi:sulfoxide reductase catalytic subunit YedY